ncbi:MAG: hypothetical protein HKN09_05860 [Saprospiraceae bacterium]|nr:hypothetical protein [Saprospiraceae bacterium]
MKQLSILFTILFLASATLITAQDDIEATGFDGDNFSLEGALELFKKAESLEDFEKQLNTEKNYVNNLDLNQDGKIDYVIVNDNLESDAHAIVLQVAVNKDETQDIAVIGIEKTGNEEAVLQIVGDEDVYGTQTIVEPYDIEGQSNGSGPNADMAFSRIVVNVWFWPSVRYIYRPSYRVWVSPYRWGYYPRWWSPWRPLSWGVYRPHVVRYRTGLGFHRVNTHRVVRAHKVYTPKRKTSTTVVKRTTVTRKKVGVNKNTKTVKTKTTKTAGVKTNKGNTAVKRNTTSKSLKKNKAGTKTGTKRTTTKKGVKTNKGAAGVKKTKTVKKKKKG